MPRPGAWTSAPTLLSAWSQARDAWGVRPALRGGDSGAQVSYKPAVGTGQWGRAALGDRPERRAATRCPGRPCRTPPTPPCRFGHPARLRGHRQRQGPVNRSASAAAMLITLVGEVRDGLADRYRGDLCLQS